MEGSGPEGQNSALRVVEPYYDEDKLAELHTDKI